MSTYSDDNATITIPEVESNIKKLQTELDALLAQLEETTDEVERERLTNEIISKRDEIKRTHRFNDDNLNKRRRCPRSQR